MTATGAIPRKGLPRRLPALLFICAAPFLLLPARGPAYAGGGEKAVDAILSSAERTFKAMKSGDYRSVWENLTALSRNTIVAETGDALAASAGNGGRPRGELLRDFSENGPVAKGYWEGFLREFDPDLVLEQSRWSMGTVGGERAEIVITHRNSERPAVLKLFREDGAWKVGLVETFWTRKEP